MRKNNSEELSQIETFSTQAKQPNIISNKDPPLPHQQL